MEWRRLRSVVLRRSERMGSIAISQKQLSSAPLGQDPTTDAIDSVTMADDAILLHGLGKKDTNRTWISEDGQFISWRLNPRFVACTHREMHRQTLMLGPFIIPALHHANSRTLPSGK